MKKQMLLVIWTAIVVVLISVGSLAAQGNKKMTKEAMDMAEMKKSPHHVSMMAYQQNELTFAKALRDMAKVGKLEDVALARNAFAEIKRSMAKMDEIHQTHMATMSAEMRAKMEPMMLKMKPKMDAEKAAMKEHIDALEKALQMDMPDARVVGKHASELVLKLEKMSAPDKKMTMSGKKPV